MIEDAAEGCGWKTLADFAPDALERFIGRKRAPDDGSKAWTPRTAHKYITALRTFTRWCVADGRLAADPLARVKKPAPTRQRERRFLSVDEWRWLRATTEHGPQRMGMDGRARRVLYELAIQTGLRSGELRSLTRSSLMLDAERPYVLLEARQTKNRKAARQYVRPELAGELAVHIARSMPGAPVFSMPRRENVAEMIRADLKAARDAPRAGFEGSSEAEGTRTPNHRIDSPVL
jgi:integrase